MAAPLTSPMQQSAAVAQLDRDIATLQSRGQFSGSVLIAQAGHVLLDRGYGLAAVQQHVLNQPTTRFRIASLTKQFTALAVLLLQEQGKLHVQDPICRYLSGCPARWTSIIIQQLLTHTSGIPDYYDAFDNGKPFTRADVLAWGKARPLDFRSGTQFRYSNTGYLLLSALIEAVSGQSYAAFLQRSIFNPLHLQATGYNQNQQRPPIYATGYAQGTTPARLNYMGPGLGDGGLYSTVDDLYRWDTALFTGHIASPRSRSAMFKQQVSWACPGRPVTQICQRGIIGYGYGWFILSEDNNVPMRIIDHSGSMRGFTSSNTYFPTQRLTVIVLSNQETFDRYRILDDVERLLIPG